MAAAKTFDVWFLSANTVYRGVPHSVVTDWAQQGRVSGDDKVRAAGSTDAWLRIGDYPDLADFLFRRGKDAAPAVPARHNEHLEPLEMDGGWGAGHADDGDDDPDMIPLIDISLVLLVFFMMTATVSALSPIEVPGMKYAAELRTDPDALTIHIDKNPRDELFYAIRVGERPPEREDNNLTSLPETLGRLNVKLDAILAKATSAPEVRIACHKDLPSERVHELAKELQRLKDKNRISLYGAEVNEKK